MTTLIRDRLPRLRKFLYAISDFSFAFTDTTMSVLWAIFMTDVAGLKLANAALVILIGRVWDAVDDPLFGFLTDRTRSRWGRRRVFLLFGAIPFGLTFAMLWFRPPTQSPILLTAYFTVAYILYDTFYTMITMPYFALTPELTQDYDERTSLTMYRMAFSITGSLTAFIVPLLIIGEMHPANAPRVFMMGLIFGAICAIPPLLAFFGTQEKPENYTRSQPGIRESVQAVWKNRPFLFAAGIFLFTWTAIDIIQVFMLYFLKYRMNMEAQSDTILGTIFVTALVVLPLWNWISEKTDKRKAYIVGMIFLSAVMITLIMLSPATSFAFIIFIAILAGIGVSAVHVLTWSIIPDAVEVDELATGQRHEGIFYSMVTFFKKIASAILVPTTLLILQWSGYVSNATIQKPSAILAIRMLMGPTPSLLLLAGIALCRLLPAQPIQPCQSPRGDRRPSRYKMILATLCYIQHAGQTLMIHRIKRADDIHLGKWNGLGGKFEPGESPEECVIREVREESGLELRQPRLCGLLMFPGFKGNDWYVFVFTAREFSGELKENR
jgi:GPH family glycoside/pentoside/hexuronide:cation symporter